MHWVDITIIAVVILSVLTGLFRGFVKEIIALCTWVLAICLGIKYSYILDPWLSKYIHDTTAKSAVSFLVVLFSVLIIGGLVNALLSFILKRSGLSGTDRTLGMCFGFIRGVFIIAFIMVAFKMSSLPYQKYENDSKLMARFNPIVNYIYGYMPGVLKQIENYQAVDKLDDKPKKVAVYQDPVLNRAET